MCQKISAEGCEIEKHAQALLRAQSDADTYSFQSIFQSEPGLYVRESKINPRELLVIEDVKNEATGVETETRAEIDESSCTCLTLTKSIHCDTLDYFNPNIPKHSIYNLPRISKAKITCFIADGRFALDKIGLDEVTEKQALILKSAQLREPVINQTVLAGFYSKA